MQVHRALGRLLRITAWTLCALLLLAAGVAARLLWFPGPGTLVMRVGEVHLGDTLGQDAGTAIVVSEPDYWQVKSSKPVVHKIVDGVALPVPVSSPTWEPASYRYIVADGKLTSVKRSYGNPEEPGGEDCLTEIPLDGSAATRRCRRSVDVYPLFNFCDRVGGDVYYCGFLTGRYNDLLAGKGGQALVRAAADGSWSVVDYGGFGDMGLEWVRSGYCRDVVHDADAVYWSTRDEVRRVSRADGSVITVFHQDLPFAPRSKQPPPNIALAGDSLLVLVPYEPRGERYELAYDYLLYKVDKRGNAYASKSEPLVRINEYVNAMASNGQALYLQSFSDRLGLWVNHVMRVRLSDGHMDVLAEHVGQGAPWGMTVAGDKVYYFVLDRVAPDAQVNLWSVPK